MAKTKTNHKLHTVKFATVPPNTEIMQLPNGQSLNISPYYGNTVNCQAWVTPKGQLFLCPNNFSPYHKRLFTKLLPCPVTTVGTVCAWGIANATHKAKVAYLVPAKITVRYTQQAFNQLPKNTIGNLFCSGANLYFVPKNLTNYQWVHALASLPGWGNQMLENNATATHVAKSYSLANTILAPVIKTT